MDEQTDLILGVGWKFKYAALAKSSFLNVFPQVASEKMVYLMSTIPSAAMLWRTRRSVHSSVFHFRRIEEILRDHMGMMAPSFGHLDINGTPSVGIVAL